MTHLISIFFIACLLVIITQSSWEEIWKPDGWESVLIFATNQFVRQSVAFLFGSHLFSDASIFMAIVDGGLNSSDERDTATAMWK